MKAFLKDLIQCFFSVWSGFGKVRVELRKKKGPCNETEHLSVAEMGFPCLGMKSLG